MGFAQTQVDYEQAISRFVSYYNHLRGDSIIKMFEHDEKSDEWMKRTWGRDHLESMHKEFGIIVSYQYLGIDKEDPNPGLAVFKTHFSRAGWKTTSLTLEKGYLATFRFITSSKSIDKMLKKEK